MSPFNAAAALAAPSLSSLPAKSGVRVSAMGVVAGRSPALDGDAGGERFSKVDSWTHEVPL